MPSAAVLLQYIHDKYEGRYKLHGYYPKSLLGAWKDRDPYDILYCACVCEDFTRENFGRLKAKGIDTWAGTRFKNREMAELARSCGVTLLPATIRGRSWGSCGRWDCINSDIKQNNLSGSR